MPLLDKDELLEALFDERGVGDLAWRRRLSHAANRRLQQQAARLPGAVLRRTRLLVAAPALAS